LGPAETGRPGVELAIDELQARLDEAEETLRALRSGEIDALVIYTPKGEQVISLRGADQTYRLLVEAMSEGAVTLTLDGTVLYSNAHFTQMVGAPLQQVIGTRFVEFIAPDEREDAQRMLTDVPTDGRKGEFTLQSVQGKTIPVYLSGCPMTSDDFTALCLVVTDVSEHQRAEMERAHREREQAARANAEAATRSRDEFFTVAAHELKTPVTGLRAFAQLLGQQLDQTGSVEPNLLRRAVDRIEEQSGKLARLVNQLLDVSRIAEGRLTIQLEPTELVSLVQRTTERAQAIAPRHQITVLAPSTHLAIEVDPLRIEQVLTNLLDNAVKFSPEGGTIQVELTQTDGEVHITVADHGIGVADEHQPFIFDRFYQAHPGSHYAGMGLGLHISREIVELHGGTLSASFPPEGGAQFRATLRAQPEAAPTERPDARDPGRELAR
jgi:PAS domain S-box-containing protein